MGSQIASRLGLFNASLAGEPIMHFFSSALLIGSYVLRSGLGRPKVQDHGALLKRSVDEFIKTQTPVVLDRLLCNIGADGCAASGAGPGVVVASPDNFDPPYFYTWTRDSALLFKGLVDRLTNYYDANLQRHIEEYIGAQAVVQGISNPSGSLSDGSGLGEAKFEVGLSAYTGAWGRPQRDGPALRATALVAYAKWLIDNGYSSTASDIVWPIARNDLEYVAEYWNNTGFDLWEEVNGSSFFTVANQHRALVEGASLAATLGKAGDKYSAIAPQILCFLQTFWGSSQGYIDSNINTNDGRTGKDINSILGSIHTFDPSLGCDATTFQPCSDRSLSNLKTVIDSFRWYNINSGISQGSAVAVGRYSEDVYYGGNPWYLTTLAVAEQLYDALYTWQHEGSIIVTQTSLSFFKDLVADISTGTYASDSRTYAALFDAASSYADGLVEIVARYVSEDGSMSEQYSKDDGTPLSAADLSWSYTSFLTATARRAGIVPPPWANDSTISLLGACQKIYMTGTYSSAMATSFPDNQTPIDGVPTRTTTTNPCTTPTSVAVTFEVRAKTEFGQTIKIVGDIEELGSWNTNNAVPLSASQYTDAVPVWTGAIKLPAGKSMEYKYINGNADGSLVWEKDPNHAYVVPRSCRMAVTKSDTWQY